MDPEKLGRSQKAVYKWLSTYPGSTSRQVGFALYHGTKTGSADRANWASNILTRLRKNGLVTLGISGWYIRSEPVDTVEFWICLGYT